MNRDEAREMAIGVLAGTVVTNLGMDKEVAQRVFMPLALINKEQFDRDVLPIIAPHLLEDPPGEGPVGLIYEHLSKAGPVAVNGMPTFFSFQMLTPEETEMLWEEMDDVQVRRVDR